MSSVVQAWLWQHPEIILGNIRPNRQSQSHWECLGSHGLNLPPRLYHHCSRLWFPSQSLACHPKRSTSIFFLKLHLNSSGRSLKMLPKNSDGLAAPYLILLASVAKLDPHSPPLEKAEMMGLRDTNVRSSSRYFFPTVFVVVSHFQLEIVKNIVLSVCIYTHTGIHESHIRLHKNHCSLWRNEVTGKNIMIKKQKRSSCKRHILFGRSEKKSVWPLFLQSFCM